MPADVTERGRADFIAELTARGRSSNRTAMVLGIIAFVSFGFVDPLLMDDGLSTALSVRAFLVAGLLGLLAISYRARSVHRLTVINCLFMGCGIIALTLLVGGGDSRYHEALLLAFFGFALLPLPWSAWTAGGTFTGLVILYDVVMVAGGARGELGAFVTNNAVLLAAALIAAVMVRVSNDLRWADFRTRRDLASANDRLKALDRAKSRFFANLSHELRTPLTLALAPMQSLLEDPRRLDPQQRESIRLAERNALRLLKLVDDLLELARAETAGLRLRLAPVDMSRLLLDLVDQVRPLAGRKRLKLTLEAEGPVREIRGDRDHLERIALNLLGNAVKFTPDRGSVRVRIAELDDAVRVEVQDTGIGIPESDLGRIFERFHQVDSSSTRRFGGTGIGLALARELVELHGGVIEATSAVGKGTTLAFEIPFAPPDSLPVEQEEASVDEQAAPLGLPEWHDQLRRSPGYRLVDIEEATERRRAPRPQSDEAPTVLVVEDNADMVTFLGGLLGSRYRVMTAGDGKEGLEQIRTRRPDLVITDVMMPRMTGFELIERMRADPGMSEIPVIVLTARGEVEDRVEGRATGADAYIAKPFHSGELMAAVRGLLSTARVRRQESRQRRDESVEALARGVARELVAPLQELDGGLEELRARLAPLVDDQDLSEGTRTNLAELLARGERARAAARDIEGSLKDLRSLSGSAIEVAPRSAVIIDDLVRRGIERAAPEPADRARIRARLDCRASLRLPIAQLEQVLGHLVTNALEATHVGGKVDVVTREEVGHVLVEILDGGPGIPAEDLERIFEPYYTTRSGVGRRGMGLALSRSVIERCGGALTVESGQELGATFRIRLARQDAG